LLREFFERPKEFLEQPILFLPPGLTTPATANVDAYLSKEVALSFDRETHLTFEEVPLSPRVGKVELPPFRRSEIITSTVPDDVVGHTSEALGAHPKTPL